jgi:hypothetical protein
MLLQNCDLKKNEHTNTQTLTHKAYILYNTCFGIWSWVSQFLRAEVTNLTVILVLCSGWTATAGGPETQRLEHDQDAGHSHVVHLLHRQHVPPQPNTGQ